MWIVNLRKVRFFYAFVFVYFLGIRFVDVGFEKRWNLEGIAIRKEIGRPIATCQF